MLLSIPPKYSVSQVMGYLKGKSAIQMARTWGGKRRNFVGQHFWARGYWVSTVGHNEAAVRVYTQEQEKADQRLDQLGLFGGEGRFERFTLTSLRLCRRWLTKWREIWGEPYFFRAASMAEKILRLRAE